MAELASAVSTLLSVISNEATRLGRVRHDVQFIQEEIESMSSFLADLSRASREHNEQVRTWMNQVRILADDCKSRIDLYLYRGDPRFHLPRGGPCRYLLWAPWQLRKLLAQHRAAGQLRELKDRAKDIGDRRLRYGVEIKMTESSSSSGAGLTEPLLLLATHNHEEEEHEDDQHGDGPIKVNLPITSMKMDKENYFRRRLDHWIRTVVQAEANLTAAGSKQLLPSIAFVVTEVEDADVLGSEALDVAKAYFKRAEDVQDKGVPRETIVLLHEYKSVPSALVHEEQAYVLPEIETNGARNVVLVDVPAMHYNFLKLRPHTILCYILAEIKRQQDIDHPRPIYLLRSDTYHYRKKMMAKIKEKIKEMHVYQNIEGIKLCNLEDGKERLSELQKSHEGGETLENRISHTPLDQLLWMLIYHSTATARSEKEKRSKSMVAELYDVIIKHTAIELEEEIEYEHRTSSKLLQEHEYEDILREVFTRSATTAANSTPGTLVDDNIKDMVKKEVKETLHELRALDRSDKNQEIGSEAAQTTPEDDFVRNKENKMEEIGKEIMKQLKIKMVMQKIQECLSGNQRILVILKVYDKYVPQWEETRNSLSPLGCECPIAGAVIVARATREDNKQYFGCPELEPIEYSLVGLYLDAVVHKTGKQVTSQYMNDRHSHQVLRDILCECKRHEFCMKIFAHALYAKPKWSNEELSKLRSTFGASAEQKALPSIMLKFCCRDLPKEYMSCLLYLAIFPQGQTIRRSTLIGRWVAERLITTKEWRWSSSVDEAEKCFDTLVARCLVCPAGIGVTAKVKSCTVDKLVYGFITKIAMQQRILETQLPRHLARHFSIFSNVRLRSSDTMEDFFKKSSQFYKLKVLDLEGCECFPQNEHYLSDICRKILMLKYLSLRGTGVTRLPSEINNLLELEVLDIRETEIPASATRSVLLRKLKRLLAGKKPKDLMAQSQSRPADKTEKVEVLCNGKLQNVLRRLSTSHVDPSPADYFSVQIPEKIEKMLGVEVLSNVKPKNQQDLIDIGGLNDLKKLGVVINKESDLIPLLSTISDLLNQSLRFLSITLDITIYKDPEAKRSLENKPKDLESLTINGSKRSLVDIRSTSTQMWKLLESLTENGKQLAKITLSCTFLSQENLNVLAKLENLRCVKLRHSAYNGSKLTFNKGEFKNLNTFLVEENKMTDITFENGAASNLEKIVLSFTSIVSISGVNCLQKLEELELKGTNNMEMVHSLFDNAKHITKVTLRDTMLEQGDLKILASNKKMRYLVLLGKFYNGSHLTFEDEFQKLNLLIVDSSESAITKISFTNSSPNLEKIAWSFKAIVSLSGIDKLPALKELELKGGDSVPNKLKEDIKKLKIRLDYKPRDKPKK